MAKLRITDEYIRSRARPQTGNVIDYDTEVKGFAVRFTRTGTPTCLFCYGSSGAAGSARRMVLGPWSEASGKRSASILPKMRAEALQLAGLVAAKRDPYAERTADAEAAAAQREAERHERQRVTTEAEAARLREERDVTVQQLWERYKDQHGSNLRGDTMRRTERRIVKYLKPVWWTRKANAITRADVIELTRPLLTQGKASEFVHVLSLIHGLYSFAVDDDVLETITDNPARGLKKKLMTKAQRPKSKDRALVTPRELRAFYLMTRPDAPAERQGNAANQRREPVTRPGRYMPADVAACLRLMMLTGCRPTEAAGIEWSEIDFHAKLWNKPDDVDGRSKSGRADVVPLVDEAIEILQERRGNGSDYVFPSGRSKREVNGGGPGVLTENRLAAGLRGVSSRLARIGVAPFAPHDMRRTVTTGLFDIDVSEYVVKRTLNHATTGVTDTHYNKSAFIKQRRKALEAWAAYLRETITGTKPQTDNVLQFPKAAGAR